MVAAGFTVDDLDDRYQAPYSINLAVQGVNRIDRRRTDVVGLTNGNDFLGHKKLQARMMAPALGPLPRHIIPAMSDRGRLRRDESATRADSGHVEA